MKSTIDQINASLASDNFSQADTLCSQLLAKDSTLAHIRAVKGWCLYQLGDLYTATSFIEEAIQQAPSNIEVVTLAFTFYMQTVNYRQLVYTAYRCMAYHSKDARSWHRLGTAHFYLGEMTSSITAFRQSLRTQYSVKSDFGLSQPLLCTEQYKEGFARYEKRFQANPAINWIQSEKLPMPQWQGESLENKHLLVWSEQGLGDTIQFAQLLSILSSQCSLIDLILRPEHASLYGVLATVEGINNISVVSNKTVVLHRRYDYHSPMMSLLHVMKIRPDTVLLGKPYMSLPISHKKKWEMPATAQRIGIVWSTRIAEVLRKVDPMHAAEKEKKSLSLPLLQPLLEQKNVTFFPLQPSITKEERQFLSHYNVDYAIDRTDTFSDTAGIIAAMDIVVSIDTAVAHLAAAMGKPTIILLHFNSDWRWQSNREDTPWYPAMELCRQTTSGNWAHAVSRAKNKLEALFLGTSD